ncbi:MAG: hypothetical protein K0T99_03080 [Alphaproteobacteria bacterium]|nr:hypothetical protein [Alphaproteobacteria bacterium]
MAVIERFDSSLANENYSFNSTISPTVSPEDDGVDYGTAAAVVGVIALCMFGLFIASSYASEKQDATSVEINAYADGVVVYGDVDDDGSL